MRTDSAILDPPGPRVFGMPPGVDFPRILVAGLRAMMADKPPEAMARTTLFVNAARMRRLVTDAFLDSGAGFLPRIRLVSDPLDGLVPPGMPAPVSNLRRRLELMRLVRRLIAMDPTLAPPEAAYDLADSLADLMAELRSEGVDPAQVAALDVADHAAYWARAKAFLSIITDHFGPGTAPDMKSLQRSAVLAQIADWDANPPGDPVVVAGSTGSRGSTALLMRAVAALPQGVLVLPGVDFALPPGAWDQLAEGWSSEDHPQYRFRRLCDDLGLSPKAIRLWPGALASDLDRNAVVSLALRPAPATETWLTDGRQLPDLLQAMQGVTLIEAPDPRTEASAIALLLRKAAEDGCTADLITPDRTLTRQVQAALNRWNILPDDSAGRPLAHTAPGRLLGQVAEMMGTAPVIDRLLALLKHPLAFSGQDRSGHLLSTRNLELHLRDQMIAFPGAETIRDWLARQSDPALLAPWAAAVTGVIEALQKAGGGPLADIVDAHRKLAEQVAAGTGDADGAGALWDREAGIAARAIMDALAADADAGEPMSLADYRSFFAAYLAGGDVREPQLSHPGIRFLGTIEARGQMAERVILAGLNEGIWPETPAPDPWLNRRMRQEAGLLLPERQIGLAAHDFQLAIAAPEVVLCRSTRDADSDRVQSRWLNRLTNLLGGLPDRNGPAALAAMRARGQVWLDRAARLDEPQQRLPPAPRPSPRPPVEHRPKRISLSRVETLIRDPYAIYAGRILRLHALNPLRPGPEPSLRGNLIHQILEDFVRQRPTSDSGPEPEASARARLMALAEAALRHMVPWPSTRLFWLARIEAATDGLLQFEATQAGQPVLLETDGALALPGLDFTLHGRPDRIDLMPDGRLLLIDYKTGAAPSAPQQKHFAKQLHMAALVAQEAGFGSLPPTEVGKIAYLEIKAGGTVKGSNLSDADLDEHRTKLINLITRYRRRSLGYSARRSMFMSDIDSDYDHLSRWGEWDTSMLPEPEDVG